MRRLSSEDGGRGKNEANRLRAAGRIPAVVYGTRKDGEGARGVAVAVDPKAVLKILHSDSGANTLINLTVDGSESRVMVKEYQLDPVTHALLHADFYQLAMDKVITVTVPVLDQGRAEGREAAGRPARLRDPRDPGAVPADRHPREHRRGRDGADAEPVDPAARPAREPEVEAGQRARDDARARRAAEGRGVGGGDGARRCAAPVAAAEPEVIKKGKTEEKEEEKKK